MDPTPRARGPCTPPRAGAHPVRPAAAAPARHAAEEPALPRHWRSGHRQDAARVRDVAAAARPGSATGALVLDERARELAQGERHRHGLHRSGARRRADHGGRHRSARRRPAQRVVRGDLGARLAARSGRRARARAESLRRGRDRRGTGSLAERLGARARPRRRPITLGIRGRRPGLLARPPRAEGLLRRTGRAARALPLPGAARRVRRSLPHEGAQLGSAARPPVVRAAARAHRPHRRAPHRQAAQRDRRRGIRRSRNPEGALRGPPAPRHRGTVARRPAQDRPLRARSHRRGISSTRGCARRQRARGCGHLPALQGSRAASGPSSTRGM